MMALISGAYNKHTAMLKFLHKTMPRQSRRVVVALSSGLSGRGLFVGCRCGGAGIIAGGRSWGGRWHCWDYSGSIVAICCFFVGIGISVGIWHRSAWCDRRALVVVR